jgi:hypothetical protein
VFLFGVLQGNFAAVILIVRVMRQIGFQFFFRMRMRVTVLMFLIAVVVVMMMTFPVLVGMFVFVLARVLVSGAGVNPKLDAFHILPLLPLEVHVKIADLQLG